MPDSSPRRSSPAASTEQLWTTAETANFLQVPKATLYQWHYLGIGPKPGRVGRHLRYDPNEVRAWFRQQQQQEAQ
jgi:predicted DNA-binding transcriptional regulator AlpA